MISSEKTVTLRILEAAEGNVIVSKEKVQVDEDGTMDYAIKSKKIYLGENDNLDNYIEIPESEVQ